MESSYLRQPGTGAALKTDVVIPALNEEETIGDVVKAFAATERIGKIIVVSDLSTDRTGQLARRHGATVVKGPGRGKGQAMARGLQEVTTPRVIFADADLYGIKPSHVNALATPAFGMVVGFRDTGRFNFMTMNTNLPPIAGERALPTNFARTLKLEGYGAEMQINNAVTRVGMRVWHFFMLGVTGKLRAGPTRMIDVLPYTSLRGVLNYSQNVQWLGPVK
jgi:glycosyltransferase involved in cell wall biosynthesis